MKDFPPPRKFLRYKPGDMPSAANENSQGQTLEDLTRLGLTGDKLRPYFKFMRMDEVVGRFDPSDSRFWNQEAVVQYFDPADHELKDTSPEDRRNTLTSPWPQAPYDRDQVVLCIQTQQSGVYMPICPVQVRHAVTVEEEGGTYPSCDDSPNVYPIKFTAKTWAKIAGHQAVSTEYLDPGDTAPDDYVLNIHEGENSYLPVGTEIQVYLVLNRWYTASCCGLPCESSESSSLSISSSFSSQSKSSASSSSNSSSSQSSLSSSSRSSQSKSSKSSSSRSSSGSSKSGSSKSSSESSLSSASASLSSASLSSASASSASLSSASGFSQSSASASQSASASLSGAFTCVDVVTNVTFNAATCVLTITKRTICFPSSLGITIGPE